MSEPTSAKHSGMSSFSLKLIAALTMLIDHIGMLLLSGDAALYCRLIGRISFPIFCFLVAEGCRHTHSKSRYLFRLGLVAILSKPIYDLAARASGYHAPTQNAIFTLLLGAALCMTIHYLSERCFNRAMFYILMLPTTALFCLLATILHTDYGLYGVLSIAIFYLVPDKILRSLSFVLVMLFYPANIQLFSCFAIIPIHFYNGERGRGIKSLFYIFYPAHLVILLFLHALLQNP